MPRIARVVAAGYPHHVTQRGNNLSDIFFDDEDRLHYLELLKQYAEQSKVLVLAYCLMSNHVHLLVIPKTREALAACIGRINLTYTQYINRKYKKYGRLWQNRFFSTVVDTDQHLWAAVRYIEYNPVKAELVGKAQDYRWSSCRSTTGLDTDPLVRTDKWLEDSDRSEYIRFLEKDDPEADLKIRRATSTGRPLGDEKFVKKLERKLSRCLSVKKPGRPRKIKGAEEEETSSKAKKKTGARKKGRKSEDTAVSSATGKKGSSGKKTVQKKARKPKSRKTKGTSS